MRAKAAEGNIPPSPIGLQLLLLMGAQFETKMKNIVQGIVADRFASDHDNKEAIMSSTAQGVSSLVTHESGTADKNIKKSIRNGIDDIHIGLYSILFIEQVAECASGRVTIIFVLKKKPIKEKTSFCIQKSQDKKSKGFTDKHNSSKHSIYL